jgi:hypothetical protein
MALPFEMNTSRHQYRGFIDVKTPSTGDFMVYCMKRIGEGQPDSCAERGGMTAMKPTITFFVTKWLPSAT